jgi:DNA-binding NtrC family response regulator
MKRTSVLIIDDDHSVREALANALDEAGYAVTQAGGVAEARTSLSVALPQAFLLDIRLRDGDGITLLRELRSAHPSLPVLMATAYGDSGRTIAAMREGAFDYLTKPFDFDYLLQTLARAVTGPSAIDTERPRRPEAPLLVGESPAMFAVWKAIGRAAASDAPVLITGETGVGKELVARAIHTNGPRSARPFVPVNLAAVPTSLLESELFGHEKGAFTGAFSRRMGRFEVAEGGTLFLDEIGDLEHSLQTKLLRVLEDKRFERVGSTSSLPSNVRILTATSRPVQSLREDLYYRLGVVRIAVPPLRDRPEDIPILVEAFLQQGGRDRAVSPRALRALSAYTWPGNIRQLRHVLENACIMKTAQVLDAEDLDLPTAPEADLPAPLDGLEDFDLAKAVARVEKTTIERALAHAKGNRALASRLLGIRRALLYARLREYGIVGDE